MMNRRKQWLFCRLVVHSQAVASIWGRDSCSFSYRLLTHRHVSPCAGVDFHLFDTCLLAFSSISNSSSCFKHHHPKALETLSCSYTRTLKSQFMSESLEMELDSFVKVKGSSQSDAPIIKIKRNHSEGVTPPVHSQEKIMRDAYAYDKGDDSKHRFEEDAENEDYDDDTGDIDDAGDVDPRANSSDEYVQEPKTQKGRHVTHGYHLVQGKMKHGMEDYLVAKIKIVNDCELGLYAIFDGHSGREVAEYLQDRLFDNILNEPDFWTNPKSAIKRVYKATDKDILENVASSRGGSTAVTAILINGEKLVVANVGDSRAVLCVNGEAKQVTVDHEPEKEKDLVESKGGTVTTEPGNVPRVDGQLAMTRAFGDAKVKDHITVVPDVIVEKIDEDVEFLILASDGLWKVMSNQDAVDCIRGLKDGKKAAEELINEALVKASQDDISCVVVMFQ